MRLGLVATIAIALRAAALPALAQSLYDTGKFAAAEAQQEAAVAACNSAGTIDPHAFVACLVRARRAFARAIAFREMSIYDDYADRLAALADKLARWEITRSEFEAGIVNADAELVKDFNRDVAAENEAARQAAVRQPSPMPASPPPFPQCRTFMAGPAMQTMCN